MPQSFTTPKKPISVFSLAGLADIVLLLLIFFLLTSNFIPQFGIQVNLPQANAAAPMESQYVTVAITEDGNYYVNQNRTDEAGLMSAVRAARGDKVAVVIRADEEATVGQMARVASIAKALDLRVLMATERE
ncbi:MAG: biopolymer transporter ExbD [Rhodothermales bacterium]|nr:biopolymer transporter ExbD [Rhodothermales bacterium]